MKKILIIHSNPFLPIEKGSDKVIYEYCELLRNKNCDLFYCINGCDKCDESFIDYFHGKVFFFKKNKYTLRNVWNKIRRLFSVNNTVDDYYPFGIEKYISKLDSKYHFDMCIINYVILSKLYKYIHVPKKAIFTHDTFTNKLEWIGENHFWLSLSPSEEAKGIRRCTDIISIQQDESILFKYYSPKSNVYTVYSPFHVNEQITQNNKSLLFLAGYNRLNYNGIKDFLDNVFPMVVNLEPEVCLIIGGTICDVLNNYKSPNVVLLGKIDNVKDFYYRADIAINPIFQGTGLKVKTFEALSFGKIVIAHKHSASGIYSPEKSPIYFAEDHKDFANKIIMALRFSNRSIIQKNSINYINSLNNYIEEEYNKILS